MIVLRITDHSKAIVLLGSLLPVLVSGFRLRFTLCLFILFRVAAE